MPLAEAIFFFFLFREAHRGSKSLPPQEEEKHFLFKTYEKPGENENVEKQKKTILNLKTRIEK